VNQWFVDSSRGLLGFGPNSIVKTYLNGHPYAVWASGTTGTSSAVGAGYTAYGRTFTFGLRYGF